MHFLKEWNVIERALEDGCQILLARKGGILDEGGIFAPAYDEFFLYPTFLHQSEQIREALKPSELLRYGEGPEEGADSPKVVSIRLFCRLAETHRVTDVARLDRLDAEHVWTPSFLRRRFEGGGEKGLTLLVVRAYRIDPTTSLPVKPDYGGCKSWVEDRDVEISLKGAVPVLSDEEFLRRRLSVRRALS